MEIKKLWRNIFQFFSAIVRTFAKEMSNLSVLFKETFQNVLNISGDLNDYPVNFCTSEFDDDYTFILFPWLKKLKTKPEILGTQLGDYLISKNYIKSFSVVKGFFNFSLPDSYWISNNANLFNSDFNFSLEIHSKQQKYLIEYCSPNTNKPLHLGHIRNILLGWSLSKILKALGHQVETTQVVNDRGIAICKSMLAWKKFSNGITPEIANIKPDHFVGDYYVLFEIKFKEEYLQWQQSEIANEVYSKLKKPDESKSEFFVRFKNEYFNQYSLLGKEARTILISWEANDPEVIQLWKKLNNWVYQGFEETFRLLNISFDHYYYESQTYLLGKDIVHDGLMNNILYKESDNSVWIDLENVGLDKKIILRSDGTSVYITQDLGTARMRFQNHRADKTIYIVADEQDYHFKVLFETLKKLKEPYADGLYHCSYGMVDLPTGKMKSREGTVVDADDLIHEVISEARHTAEERGEITALPLEEQEVIFSKIGFAALKYFILKVAPKKRMIFDPKESVDMQGHTGPYIVNAYVRIKSILRKANCKNSNVLPDYVDRSEKNLLRQLLDYPKILQESARTYDPSHLANYLYFVAKDYHKYYHDFRILKAESDNLIEWRLMLSENILKVLEHGMDCLGIQMPDRM